MPQQEAAVTNGRNIMTGKASKTPTVTTAAEQAGHFETLLFGARDGIATVTFNRPEQRNALTIRFFTEMLEALDIVEADDSIRVLVLAGNGPAFCAGRDFKESTRATPAEGALYGRLNLGTRDRLRKLPKPVIGRVHGPAAGGGCAIATECCDITVASKSARFSIREVQAGTLPGLPLFTLGRARSLGMLLTGDWVSGEQAERWGLVYKAVEDRELDGAVAAIAKQLAGQPVQAMAYTKRAMSYLLDLAGHTQAEQFLAECRKLLHQTSERVEAQQAFIDKKRR
ncbi:MULTISPECIES: enoyl-CoA hydratase/isomerase family protein [unclassified Mesorhizobium]|uniref:enoyl-CoA hydratase/isomerase family protein n=1 Tax=unclassified Mesorhizobium TaxID=325217 RepID=UPI001128BDB1|nr:MULTISPECIES: enoyl-CoA hydratase/isomerase family protein [unclassified Mesorhizobium]MBZ9894365.1 enoyl-CoA hydratase/isomerase family protein [Mesorhizobium sp. BR1-1-6]TPM57676.1 enoyl-CoA hydratase/isomerase family protein [Mesorhizobium sp. B2-2-4]TPM65521.1 enoyl-CoA hydratase/isomerase family protein [Mesorhizobium sp. B2-2-1]TPM98496.1 enoyl-CoA hydratase/isomerase family protein [Mesorhizobium sp. B2-1-5]TPN38569.1 enoyl-CoA hydratase/isomerase family protein [Mesorhizobium sp. B1